MEIQKKKKKKKIRKKGFLFVFLWNTSFVTSVNDTQCKEHVLVTAGDWAPEQKLWTQFTVAPRFLILGLMQGDKRIKVHSLKLVTGAGRSIQCLRFHSCWQHRFNCCWFPRSSRSDTRLHAHEQQQRSSSNCWQSTVSVHGQKERVSSFPELSHLELHSLFLAAKLPARHPEISQLSWCFPLAPLNAWWNTESARWCIGKDDRVLNAKEMLHCQESTQIVPRTKLRLNVDLKRNVYFLLNIKSVCDCFQKNQHNCCCHIVLSTKRSDRWLLIT